MLMMLLEFGLILFLNNMLLLSCVLRVSPTSESPQLKCQHVRHDRFLRLRARIVVMFPIMPNKPTTSTPTPMKRI